jgi:putative holliday junction resolvase
MGRILAIDYGQKRVGIAATDPLQMIANGITTVHVKDIFTWLDAYFGNEEVESVVIGEPRQMNNSASESVAFIEPFVRKFKNRYPDIEVFRFDERFTSVIAQQTLKDAGLKKSRRHDKGMIDTISAVIILQSFLQSREHKFI